MRGVALADAELRYTAPELLTGRNADVRSDVFTMGVLAYEMATATRPYDGGSMPELLGNMLRGEPAAPRTGSQRCRRQPARRCSGPCARRRKTASRPRRSSVRRCFSGAGVRP